MTKKPHCDCGDSGICREECPRYEQKMRGQLQRKSKHDPPQLIDPADERYLNILKNKLDDWNIENYQVNDIAFLLRIIKKLKLFITPIKKK